MAEHNYIIINSSDRISGTSSDFKINVANKIRLNGKDKVKLISVIMYNTIYTVNNNNNKIDFVENNIIKSTSLTNGYYSASALAQHVGNALTSASGGYATFTSLYSGLTGKLLISSTQNFSLKFLTGVNSATSAYKILGYTDTNGINAIDTALSTSSLGNSVVNLSLPTMIYISINNWNGSNLKDTSGTTASFAIPLYASYNQIINLNGNELNQCINIPPGITIINNLQITLSSSQNVPIDLNNSEWSLILEII